MSRCSLATDGGVSYASLLAALPNVSGPVLVTPARPRPESSFRSSWESPSWSSSLSSLMEDYYEDNVNDPEKKEAMVKQLESLLQGDKLQ